MALCSDNFENSEKILRLAEVERCVGLKRSCIYALIQTGKFPRQFHLTERSVGWRNSEIQQWIREREVVNG